MFIYYFFVISKFVRVRHLRVVIAQRCYQSRCETTRKTQRNAFVAKTPATVPLIFNFFLFLLQKYTRAVCSGSSNVCGTKTVVKNRENESLSTSVRLRDGGCETRTSSVPNPDRCADQQNRSGINLYQRIDRSVTVSPSCN